MSRNSLALALGIFLSAAPALKGEELPYYLPEDVTYNKAIPTPAEYLGFEVGEWHARPDQIVGYFQEVARHSNRVTVDIYGYSHEKRPLILAKISSPKNIENMEALRQEHGEFAFSGEGNKEPGPAVAWMGYGVHGDEPSASNAAFLVLYHLAAAEGKAIEAQLAQSIILIDACINPDGNARFAEWVNSHRGAELVDHSLHREHNEAWPRGRTNHYWFDLNRDWLLLTHPESKARIEQFHRWMPNVLTDYHEMGTASSYFFQPGIPSRQNPYTPARNLALTRKIAKYNADALDEIGSLYYSEESFDDFYYGKGSTYPDVHGCIGILFEQASARGHLQTNSYGPLSFSFAIRNHFRTSLGTLRAAFEMREELLDYQRDFYATVSSKAAASKKKAVVFGLLNDRPRVEAFLDILKRHQIQVAPLDESLTVGDHSYSTESSYVVSLNQPQHRLILSLFDRRTEFLDNSFYDVSAWNLADSFGIPFSFVEALPKVSFSERTRRALSNPLEGDSIVAYAFEWTSYFAPRALYDLLRSDIKCRVSTRNIEASTSNGQVKLSPGTVIVNVGNQRDKQGEIVKRLSQAVERDQIDVHSLLSGRTVHGLDLGSPAIRPIEKPEPLMLIGKGVSAYEAGEAWHLLDLRVSMPLTMADRSDFSTSDLDSFTHLILMSGASSFDDEETKAIENWIRNGGIVIAVKRSVSYVTEQLLHRKMKLAEPHPLGRERSYSDYDDVRAVERIGGAIFEVELDRGHPIAFGYSYDRLPVFRSSTLFMEDGENPYTDVARYSNNPLLSGFASTGNQDAIRGGLAVSADALGRGAVIRFIDNPNFRGVWYGTNKLFLNSLFFSGAIQSTPLGYEDEEDEH